MDFPFDVDAVFTPFFVHPLNYKDLFESDWDTENEKLIILDSACNNHGLPRNGTGGVHQLREVIDAMGIASARAQGLRAPVTTFSKYQIHTNRIYLKTFRGKIVGLLKTGPKRLFMRDKEGTLHELEPACVLDFYVSERFQRSGHGWSLFKAMLRYEGSLPELIAYDRPSPKLLGFLRKHCVLSSFVPQSNNFVLFDKYFSVPRQTQNAAAQEGTRIRSRLGEVRALPPSRLAELSEELLPSPVNSSQPLNGNLNTSSSPNVSLPLGASDSPRRSLQAQRRAEEVERRQALPASSNTGGLSGAENERRKTPTFEVNRIVQRQTHGNPNLSVPQQQQKQKQLDGPREREREVLDNSVRETQSRMAGRPSFAPANCFASSAAVGGGGGGGQSFSSNDGVDARRGGYGLQGGVGRAVTGAPAGHPLQSRNEGGGLGGGSFQAGVAAPSHAAGRGKGGVRPPGQQNRATPPFGVTPVPSQGRAGVSPPRGDRFSLHTPIPMQQQQQCSLVRSAVEKERERERERESQRRMAVGRRRPPPHGPGNIYSPTHQQQQQSTSRRVSPTQRRRVGGSTPSQALGKTPPPQRPSVSVQVHHQTNAKSQHIPLEQKNHRSKLLPGPHPFVVGGAHARAAWAMHGAAGRDTRAAGVRSAHSHYAT
uniref:Alpha-tubulin N-acetyltransferase n=1 Tax=Chromera velia CCMP2878 TaxID=1169474 RepID=A0A0G4I1G4_9ALVE|eukprot:Cvel_10147.t1-p1 / transcript=Cvel_10147.t1 / gene=Cvel_10147 / organism=Chromera_velia_CCMP2878 / gene_product=Alpha-tubulin N-acetyltransferase, putative / transcript_product=Alpha-tubulin N-acetyltransferase, putative / location=Cvel_scaffold605:35576-38073(-) / protein_length=652 / sequence_SO=supercontig / SO=protein_coding / is_pseudo=false